MTSGESQTWNKPRRISRLRLHLALLTTLASSLMGCSDSLYGPDDSLLLPGLIGQWDWLSSCGGISGGCINPQTSNRTQTWVFTSEHLFQWFESSSLVLSGKFSVVEGELGILNQTANILWVNDVSIGVALELVAPDTLRVREDCYDCFTSIWGRHY